MFTSERKFKKSSETQKLSELEKDVAHQLFELEVHNQEWKSILQPLSFVGAKEIKGSAAGKACIVIHVPLRELPQFKKVQVKLVEELEKKLGKHILIIGKRTALSTPKSSLVHRPRSRSKASVVEQTLRDICYPAEVVGRRNRVKLDGSEHLKIFLDKKERNRVEGKLRTFSSAMKDLTGKTSSFVFAQ